MLEFTLNYVFAMHYFGSLFTFVAFEVRKGQRKHNRDQDNRQLRDSIAGTGCK